MPDVTGTPIEGRVVSKHQRAQNVKTGKKPSPFFNVSRVVPLGLRKEYRSMWRAMQRRYKRGMDARLAVRVPLPEPPRQRRERREQDEL